MSRVEFAAYPPEIAEWDRNWAYAKSTRLIFALKSWFYKHFERSTFYCIVIVNGLVFRSFSREKERDLHQQASWRKSHFKLAFVGSQVFFLHHWIETSLEVPSSTSIELIRLFVKKGNWIHLSKPGGVWTTKHLKRIILDWVAFQNF